MVLIEEAVAEGFEAEEVVDSEVEEAFNRTMDLQIRF